MAKLNSGTRIYGNVTVDTFVTATGNVTGGNILTAGLVSATGTITSATNITGGNLLTAGLVSATGTITTAGNLSLTGNIVDIGELWINTTANGNINLNPNGTGQVNIPVGILSVTGNIQGGNLRTAGLISATGNITGGNVISGGVRAYKWTTQANTAPSDAVPGDAWYDSYASKYYLYVNDGTGNQWVDQSFPTSFYDLSVTGNIQGGNVLTNGLVSATGNITGSYFIGNGSQLTGLPAGYSNADVATFLASFGSNTISTTGTITAGNISPGNVTTTGQVSATGNITGGNIFTAGSISATGNINGSNLAIGNIVNSNGNGVGNIGSATGYFNTVFAKATSAQYADVAEKYTADADYPVGTVLRIGGIHEVSQTNIYHATNIVGTVSDKPAYVMNSGLAAEHVAVVALLGRVPCRVTGTISKGDLLVSSKMPGVAAVLDPDLWVPGCVIGKALEDYDGNSEGTIEIVVGRA